MAIDDESFFLRVSLIFTGIYYFEINTFRFVIFDEYCILYCLQTIAVLWLFVIATALF